MPEVHKRVHAAGEGDDVLHGAENLKHGLEGGTWQPGVKVAQPQVLAGVLLRTILLEDKERGVSD